MKLSGRERIDDGSALEELFGQLPVTADWTVGFLTAVCTGPDPIAAAAWIAEIVPEEPTDDLTSRAKVDLLARLYGAVVETLGKSPEIIPPEPDKPAQEVVDFCTGYVKGARMHATWKSDPVASEKLLPFEALAADGSTAPHRERLGTYVAEMRAYWQSKRQVVNLTPKVGRNDPCPCGSGKKHKKCCLAKQA